MQMWTRNDIIGKWNSIESEQPPTPDFVPKPASVTPVNLPSELATDILKSLVMVTFNTPYVIDGMYSDSYFGLGI